MAWNLAGSSDVYYDGPENPAKNIPEHDPLKPNIQDVPKGLPSLGFRAWGIPAFRGLGFGCCHMVLPCLSKHNRVSQAAGLRVQGSTRVSQGCSGVGFAFYLVFWHSGLSARSLI